jgi:rubrerythrin
MAKKVVKAFEIYVKALDMEKTGESFYEKTAQTSKTAVGKKLFKMLADDELVHMARINKIYDSINKQEKVGKDWKKLKIKHPDIRKIFADLAIKNKDKIKPESTDLDGLEVGMDLENHSINFYEAQLKKSTDADEKVFLKQMVIEEQTHLRVLSDMEFYLTNPESWYVEREKHGLDGA